MARKWTNIMAHEGTILRMREEGKTRQEIADAIGLEKVQIKGFIKQHNRRQRAGNIVPKKKGRPRKIVVTAESRIEELEREVALLRSFLRVTGRM